MKRSVYESRSRSYTVTLLYSRITGHRITDKNGYLTDPFFTYYGRKRSVFVSHSTVNDTVTDSVLIDLGLSPLCRVEQTYLFYGRKARCSCSLLPSILSDYRVDETSLYSSQFLAFRTKLLTINDYVCFIQR